MNEKPLALIAFKPFPCFVCQKPTQRIRSVTHLNGPPTHLKDYAFICLDCDADWTFAVLATKPKSKN